MTLFKLNDDDFVLKTPFGCLTGTRNAIVLYMERAGIGPNDIGEALLDLWLYKSRVALFGVNGTYICVEREF